MTLQFKPPDWLIQQYLQKPRPIDQLAQTVAGISNERLQERAQQQKNQNDALKSYIDAFGAGGPTLAKDVGARMGLRNPPTLPGSVPPPVSSTGTVPSPMANPTAVTPTEEAAQQSLPSEHPVGVPDTTTGISPIIQASIAAGHPNHSGLRLPSAEDPVALANMGSYGTKKLTALESVQKLTDAQKNTADKAEENGPKTFDYARAYAGNAGAPQAAEGFIKLAQDEGRNTLTKREMADLKDSMSASANIGRGEYFGGMLGLNKSKFQNQLLQEGNKALNPNVAGGALKPQQERLNRIGRAEALIGQMNAQKGGGDTRQMRELGTSLASILTGGNVVAVNQISELVPETYKGDINKFFEKLSNNPTGLDQQQFVTRLADTISREKGTINKQIQGAQKQALPGLAVLQQTNPKGFKGIVDANVNNPEYQGQQQTTGPHGPTVIQNGHTYTWNGTTYE